MALGDNPAVGVVMRLRDFDPGAERALRSVLEQRGVDTCVYMVTNSEDIASLRKSVAPFGCRVVQYPDEPFSYSRALNIGFSEVTEPFVLSFSSHCGLLRPELLRAMIDELTASPLAGAVSLGKRPGRGDGPLGIDREVVSLKQFTGLNGAHNPCALYRKSDWEALAFDENLPTVEDQQWSFQWMSRSPEHHIVHLSTYAVSRAAQKNPISKASRDVYVAARLFELPAMMGLRGLLLRPVFSRSGRGACPIVKFVVRRMLIYANCLWFRLSRRRVESFAS